MSERLGVLAVVVLAGGLSAQEAGPCGEEVPTLYLRAPAAKDGVLSLRWGPETPGIEVEARIRTGDFDVMGYSLSVETIEGPLEILAFETGNVLIDAAGGGFHKTDLARRGWPQQGPVVGFVSAFVPSLTEFTPPRGDYPLVRAWYGIDIDQEPSPILEFRARIEYRDGLRGRGQPVQNGLLIGGDFIVPCTEALDLQVRVEVPFFLRGDANADGVLDVSDPVTLLRSQFRGDAVIRCDDAADANDDRQVDLTDAIYVFNYLFRGGPPPSAPFPEPGWDVTEDDLDCDVSLTGSE